MPKLKHNLLFKTVRILRNDWHRFEYDPQVQLTYHRRMTLFWLNNFLPMNTIVGIDIWATLTGHDKVALLMTAVLLAINTNYSLYANFDTETGDAHAAYTGVKADEIKHRQEANTSIVRHERAESSPLVNEQSNYSVPIAREIGREIVPEAELLAEFDA